MNNNKLSSYSIIPTIIIQNKNLSSSAKLVYAIISSLCNEKGYCWASNKYLGEMIGVGETAISLIIKDLSDVGLIKSELERNYIRKIYINEVVGVYKKLKGVLKKVKGGVLKKVKDNNISNNNISNSNTSTQSGDCIVKEMTYEQKVSDIINEFKPINPVINFGNITQRKSVDILLKEFSYEELKAMVKITIKHQGKPYMPTITTPWQFKEKIGDIKVYFNRLKNKANKSKITSI